MALVFPRTDILSVTRFSDQKFVLNSRQEFSVQANGVNRGKDFGSAVWSAEFTTVQMRSDDGVAYEAMLNSLDGVINPFEAGDLRRINPRSHPNGDFSDTAQIASITAGGGSISLAGLPAGFVLSPGDYLSFDYGDSRRALHQIVESATANGGGLTPVFEVRPRLRPGASNGIAVKLNQPRGWFTLQPNSITSTVSVGLITQINFKAIQYV